MSERMEAIRAEMKKRGLDAWLATMDDEHLSEYVDAHDRVICAVSGFTGSAGTLVVTEAEAALWTDGRYYVQAERELSGSGIVLMRSGEASTPKVSEYLKEKLPQGAKLGFCGKRMAAAEALSLSEELYAKQIQMDWEEDLADAVWEDRPAATASPCFILEEKYAGKSAKEKLCELRKEMEKCGADTHVIGMLDDIAWLLNLRAHDIPCNPVFQAFLLLDQDKTFLYISEQHLTEEVSAYLQALSIDVVTEPDRIYTDVRALTNRSVLLEAGKTNFALYSSVSGGCRILNRMLPTTLAKAKKNRTERENLRLAHRKDGVALTRFMYWFQRTIKRKPLTEWETVEKLHAFRAEQEGFVEESFETIAAYGANAAMCHYAPSKEKDTAIEQRGLFLVDSGGQYLEGTTDVTRTFVCGPCTAEEKRDLTLSVIANLRLADARFPEGTVGVALDYIAREPFWTRGLQYDHGTGHGVGYFLNVHERPVGIRYRLVPERQDCSPFQEGMFVSDEPGLYIEGSHGVRTENMLMCVNDQKTAFGQFCRFEIYTLCPIDRRGLDLAFMEDRDISLLNAYHYKVYTTLAPYMDDAEREWLREACAPLHR